ncbi:hypothetical protein AX16_008216 [Volvariella volvacea WC 439]|nr:hypothetical protein AX16_008216 [Volvariella volvacea WC 439]
MRSSSTNHPPSLDDQDESVRIAVRALDDMRNAASRSDRRSSQAQNTASSPSTASTSSPRSPSPYRSSPTTSMDAHSPPQQVDNPPPTNFVSRVTHLPLVNSAWRVYEQGKASSRVVKYGAEMMESSVKTISRPVIDRIPAQWDEFACRQLNKIERYRRPSTSNPEGPSFSSARPQQENVTVTPADSATSQDQERGRTRLKTKTLDGSAVDDRDASMMRQDFLPPPTESDSTYRSRDDRIPAWREATSPFVHPPPPPPDLPSDYERDYPRDRSTQSQQGQNQTASSSSPRRETQVVQRSRWQAVLLEAGGLSAALSEESMRRLKYCLQWLLYATAHIDAQILILRDFIASLQPLPSASSSSSSSGARHGSSSSSSSSLGDPAISSMHMRTLTDVRKDIVNTVKQVVDIVSKYAGGALPEPARNRVRGFILKLPQRWANRAGVPVPASAGDEDGGGGGGGSGSGSGKERDRERDSVTAAASGIMRRGGGVGNRRAVHRERGLSGVENGTAGGGGGVGGGKRSSASSRATSPCASPRIVRSSLQQQQQDGYLGAGGGGDGTTGVTPGAAVVAAQRILVLATESLDMMRGVTGVVKESLDRADAWVGRLRTVGIQRGQGQNGDEEDVELNATPPPPPGASGSERERERERDGGQYRHHHHHHHRYGPSYENGPYPSYPHGHGHGHGQSHSRHTSTSTSTSASGHSYGRQYDEEYERDRERERERGVGSPYSGSSTLYSGSSYSLHSLAAPGGPGPAYGPSLPSSSSGLHSPGNGNGTMGLGSPGLGTLGLNSMSLGSGSRYSTPRSGVVELPLEEEEEEEEMDEDRERHRERDGDGERYRDGKRRSRGSLSDGGTMVDEDEMEVEKGWRKGRKYADAGEERERDRMDVDA